MPWTSTQLHELAHTQLRGRRLVVVSNREPYIHKDVGGEIVCEQPASGVASGLDAVLRTCGGVWVAHGGGTADRRMVDAHDRLRVPPQQPRYTLKRVWLTAEEETGYYYGFANEGLWPLCHAVATRPRFVHADWTAYARVNEKFAHAVLAEIGTALAVVWIQDYHFALLPRLLKDARPDLLVAQFWHIPWPPPEAFRVCPWKNDLLQGLLANDLLGFHLRSYCDNFLATVDRECAGQVDRERSAVLHRAGAETVVRPFPMSTDFSTLARQAESAAVRDEATRIQRTYGLQGRRLCLGLDRVDYTKGIPERLRAVDRLFSKYPRYRRHLVFLQAGPESRGRLSHYQALNAEIDTLVDDINHRHGTTDWTPVLLLRQHFPLTQVLALYRLAEVCVVSALHDGMNLVAKEYVAAKNDEAGVLLLSQFTGAAQELQHALLINPYDRETFADTLARALEMAADERAHRMRALRDTVAEHNIYRWAGQVLHTLTTLPYQVKKEASPPPQARFAARCLVEAKTIHPQSLAGD